MSEFNNSRWDATNWTIEQKTRWQERCFAMKLPWYVDPNFVTHPEGKTYYYIGQGEIIACGGEVFHFVSSRFQEKQYCDMFPEVEIKPSFLN